MPRFCGRWFSGWAERELYILMPELFELARIQQPAAAFALQTDQWLREEYVGLVKDMRAADRLGLADQLLDEALGDFPSDRQLNELKQPVATEKATST